MTALWIVLGVLAYMTVGVGIVRFRLGIKSGYDPYCINSHERGFLCVFWPVYLLVIGRLAGGKRED